MKRPTSILLLLVASFLVADEPPAKEPSRTILTYEIDWKLVADQDRPEVLKTLIESLKTRIDPDGARKIAIRTAAKDRLEIILPTGKTDVQRIKQLLARSGNLEFRILANGHDDKEAIADARALFEKDGIDNDLEKLQRQGLPPPGPRGEDKQAKKYYIALTGGARSLVTYTWVELSPQELQYLNLDNAASDDPKRKFNWRHLAKHRNKALTLPVTGFNDQGEPVALPLPIWQAAIFFSRECHDGNLTPVERKAKAIEYFVLARDPEIDPKTNTRTPALNSTHLATVRKEIMRNPPPTEVGRESYPVISFTLNEQGAKLFRELTRSNAPMDAKGRNVKFEPKDGVIDIPDGTIRRHLGILLDGQLLSAPTLNSEIAGGKGQIAGNFTEQEVDAFVGILKAGALPASLRPRPVSETTAGPKGNEEKKQRPSS